MSITTYAELKTAVASWLARTSDTDFTAMVPDFITLSEAAIYRRLRVREMETAVDLTISTQATALPSGFIGARRLYLSTNPIYMLEPVSVEYIYSRWASETGQPAHYAIEGDNLIVGPTPDQTYTGKLLYWKRLAALSSAVNNLFTNNPDLFLYGALLQAAPYIADDARIATWAQFYQAIIDGIETSNLRDRFPAGMRSVPDAVV